MLAAMEAGERVPLVAPPEVTLPDWGFFRLLFSDYRMHYRHKRESDRRARVLFLPRFLVNPPIQFATLVRLAQRGPRLLLHPVRWLMVVMFSGEFYAFHLGPGIKLGAAIDFPHPYGVMVAPGTVIGSRVAIYHQTRIGSNRRWSPGDEAFAPTLGDDVVIGGDSRVMGPYRIGEGAVIGVNALVRQDVPPGAMLLDTGKLKVRGEWDDPRLEGREPRGPALD